MGLIAVLVNPENPCPPTAYGGNERQIPIIVTGLLSEGHAVDAYVGPGSKLTATHTMMVPERNAKSQVAYINEILRLKSMNLRYDCFVDMSSDHVASIALNAKNVVSIMTGDPLHKYPHDNVNNRVYVSKEFAEFNNCPDHPVLHNVFHANPASLGTGPGGGGYALYVATIRPEKGLLEATKACQMAGLPLRVYGPVKHWKFWDAIRDSVEYRGMLENNDVVRAEAFGRAEVFMFCPLWCDAGPLAPMEAMAYGTPVVGFANGGMSSDVEDGVGGYLIREGKPDPNDTIKDLAKMIGEARKLNREKVRASILPKVNPGNYINKLATLVQEVIAGKEW